MFTALPFCFAESEDFAPILISSFVAMLVGLICWLFTKRNLQRVIRIKESYLIVTLGWILMSITGTLPFLISGAIPSFTDAFFETMSGFTTTGASLLTDIESVPKNILFWRSMTHWIGGMGIIVLAIAIMPILGFGGMQMFSAESSGLTTSKLHPRITATAKRLWIIYVMFTAVETILLMFGGMNFFDAINHSMSTVSTGGFSTKNTSLVEANPYIQYVVTFFMFIAGINFSLHYVFLKGRFGNVFRNEELRFYGSVVIVISIVVAAALFFKHDLPLEQATRESLFTIVSMVNGTGFVVTDYEQWSPFLMYIIFIVSFFGACAGSTAGGLKMIRVRLLLKNSVLELRRLLHTRRTLIPVKMNGKTIPNEVMAKVLAFFFFYIIMFVSGSIALSIVGMDFISAMSAVVACLSNVGPGIGSVGALDNYAHVPAFGKWALSFLMLVGRLEIFTVLLLLTPAFWRRI